MGYFCAEDLVLLRTTPLAFEIILATMQRKSRLKIKRVDQEPYSVMALGLKREIEDNGFQFLLFFFGRGRGGGVVNKMQYGLAEDSKLTVASRNVGFAVGTR